MWHLCPLSKKIWKTTYKFLKYTTEPTPFTINNILQATNISLAYKRKAVIWIYMNTLYEIWC
ncbi:854_t:CDS:2 [Cetraspora pellucida]|uniref:854_t:CDS:1 n=1 Tax=Cetraspora pellucida TaxID=1433469 RepID=A0A9N9DQD2_9GLOM|nr:854_t:CDS:2 [Cetraspora pellucida]